MLRKQIFLITVFTLVLIMVTGSCHNDEKFVQFDKERIIYQEKVQSAVDRLDMKIAELRAKTENDEVEKKNLEPYIADLEILEENLNQDLGELTNVSIDDWKGTKSQIDSTLADMDENLEKIAEILQAK